MFGSRHSTNSKKMTANTWVVISLLVILEYKWLEIHRNYNILICTSGYVVHNLSQCTKWQVRIKEHIYVLIALLGINQVQGELFSVAPELFYNNQIIQVKATTEQKCYSSSNIYFAFFHNSILPAWVAPDSYKYRSCVSHPGQQSSRLLICLCKDRQHY